jgi:serine/threonine protein kinase
MLSAASPSNQLPGGLMSNQLQVISGPDQGRTFPLPVADTLLIGRSRALEARLTDPYVSRVHCQLETDGTRVLLTDFESAGGTCVNGQRVTQQQLQPGDVIQIGETSLQFQASAPPGNLADQETLPPKATGPAQPAVPPLRPVDLTGQTIVHYQVGPILARGRSGVVYHAHDTRYDQPVALKVLRPEFSQDEDQKQRFVRAMKTALPLRHPNLVTVYRAGKTGPHCWVAMEYVEGESLTQVVQRIGTVGMLDWRTALRVAVHVARALDFAHQQQIIHRNVTPMNILIQANTRMAKLGDLLLAKALEGTLAQPITRPGELLGNVHFLAPERTQGGASVDGRSDFYGLGATVYALLTGRPPFEGANVSETVSLIRHGDLVRPKRYQLAIPDLFEGAVVKMLARRPEDRYQTSAEVLADLERIARFQGLAV